MTTHAKQRTHAHKVPRVYISVVGGVAHLTRRPPNVRVIITDYDQPRAERRAEY